MKKSHVIGIGLMAIVLVGSLLRAYGIAFGLPFVYDLDEPVFMHTASAMLANRDLNPHWFGHPGTTVIVMMSAMYGLIYAVGFITGSFANAAEFKAIYYHDPTLFYLSGRILCALFGIASILLLYAVVRRLSNPRAGLISATLLALSPLHAYYSKIVRTDVVATFLILVVFWFCLDVLKKKTWSSYALAGFFAGLALATKYPAVIVALVIVAAYLFNRIWKDFSKLVLAGLACVLGAFAGSPYLFLDWRTALASIRFENRAVHLSAMGEGFVRNLIWYLRGPFFSVLPIVGLMLAVIGIVLCASTRNKEKWLLLVFPVSFMLFIPSLHLRWERWVIPIIPFLCILVAFALDWMQDQLGRRFHAAIKIGVVSVVLLACVVPMVKADIVRGRELSGKDTRTMAGEWILEHIPKGSRILLETHTPHLPKNAYAYLLVNSSGELVDVDAKSIIHSVFRPPYSQIGMLKNADALRRQHVDYMIINSWYDRYLSERYRSADNGNRVRMYETLMNMGTKLYEVCRVYAKNTGPTIRVYRFD